MTAAVTLFQPGRLKLARAFTGMTLADLGLKVGATRQFIQQVERGAKRPTSLMVDALADALNLEPPFFYAPPPVAAPEALFSFRKRQSTPATIKTQAVAHGLLFAELVAYLDGQLGLPEIDMPSVKATDGRDLEQIAEECRSAWGLGVDRPIDSVVRAVENAGCVITPFQSPNDKLDAFSAWLGRPIIVRSTAKASGTRARFDIAHELGHLVLHRGRLGEGPHLEDEADGFASAFLLPRRGFVPEYPKRLRIDWIALFRLKKRWGASVAAIVRRAYDLDLLGASQYRWANVYIHRMKWHRGEPQEWDVEEPELMGLCFERLLELNTSPRDVASRLGLSQDVLAKVTGLRFPHGTDSVRPLGIARRVLPPAPQT